MGKGAKGRQSRQQLRRVHRPSSNKARSFVTKSLALGRGKSLGKRQGKDREDKGGCRVEGVGLGKNLEAIFKNFIPDVERSLGGSEAGEQEISSRNVALESCKVRGSG